jgi:hypothetical protein
MILPPGGGGRVYFPAESETTFVRVIVGDSVEFVRDASGTVTHFIYLSGRRRAKGRPQRSEVSFLCSRW